MTKYELERMRYIIKEANKATYVGLGPADAIIIQRLIQEYDEKDKWEASLAGIREGLRNETS